VKVRFCEHNKGSVNIFKRLKENFPGLNLKRKDCIGKCGPCHKTPFATVDKKAVCATDGEELYDKIVKLIKTG